MTAYVRWLVAISTLAIAIVAGVNIGVDPYGLLGTEGFDGWTLPKTEVPHYTRMVKAYELCAAEPVAIALGFSDVALGIDPDHPGWAARPAFNIALGGGNMHELRRYFEHAQARHSVRQAVLSLDLTFFNENLPDRPDFAEWRLGNGDRDSGACSGSLEPWTISPSIDTLRSSLATIFKNATSRPTWIVRPDGTWAWRREEEVLRRYGGAAGIFASAAGKGFADRLQRPPFRLGHFDDLRAIVALALRSGVDLRIFLGPVHAFALETRRLQGLEIAQREWIRAIVAIAATESAKVPGTPPVPVWSFTGYNRVTTEEVPPAGDLTPMRGYSDWVHYRRVIGDQILDRVLGAEPETAPVDEPFGVRLTPENVDHLLELDREAGERYRRSHAAEIAAIEALAEASWKRAEARGSLLARGGREGPSGPVVE